MPDTPPSKVLTSLVRTKGGNVVHRRDCSTIGNLTTSNMVAWEWAEGRQTWEIREAMAMVGSRACKICRPAAEIRR